MAPLRGRSMVANAYDNRSCDSSPDPLALSMDESNARGMRRACGREPLTATSPSKQNRASNVKELEFSSPAKSMIMNTPRMGGASPWRIKVTVQAEPESNEEQSPSIQRVTRTKTTTVPLKDHDAQTPAKRPRGRPRKSDVATAATATKPRRRGTPAKKPSRSKSREESSAPAEASEADADIDAPPKRRRGRPRKKIQPLPGDEDTPVIQAPQAQSELVPGATSQVISSTLGTRLATSDILESSLETTDATPSQAYTSNQSGARKGTPHSKKVVSEYNTSEHDLNDDGDDLTPASGDEVVEFEEATLGSLAPHDLGEPTTVTQKAVAPSYTESNDSISSPDDGQLAAPLAQDIEDGDYDDNQEMTNFAFDEGTTRMPDDTTVLDSENFSMISVDSLLSGGSLSSPPQQEQSQGAVAHNIDSLINHEYLAPTADVIAALAPRSTPLITLDQAKESGQSGPSGPVRPTFHRYKTPVVETEVPAAPPAIKPAPITSPKNETPKMGRVVTAGVALQGALDPSRVTPDHLRRDGMDDLFRGFSEGTRKDLQAGFRLGEQLAGSQTKESPMVNLSSSLGAQPDAAPKQGVYRTQRKYRASRLLTPEDQDDHVITYPEQPTANSSVQYPTLNTEQIENSLLSPARSENEMSWRLDTPPANINIGELDRSVALAGKQLCQLQNTQVAASAVESKSTAQDDYSDIWQEEASRSSDSPEAEDPVASKLPQLQDLFEEDVLIKPAHGNLSRNWRRKTADHSRYSGETKSANQNIQHATIEVPAVEVVRQEEGDASDVSEGSDDTGMFFQSNMPNLFNKKRSTELRQRKVDKHSLSSLLNGGESLLPDSSPPVMAQTTPVAKTNPFVATPPRFQGFPCSPSKSSPLRRELRISEISPEASHSIEDESTLPLLQSSPFHTFVDGDSRVSVASDQRQFRFEMEGSTSASIRQVREEANDYLDAYEPQERSLNEITEVTEPSRTWHAAKTMPSSPPRRQSFAQHMQSPTRKPVLLFNPDKRSHNALISNSVCSTEHKNNEATSESSMNGDTPPSSNAASQQSEEQRTTENLQQQTTGFLARVASSVLNTLTRPQGPLQAASPSPHPILSRLSPLPEVQPWTKTHYKVLDKLYITHLKHPALFTPSVTPATPLSTTNAQLLGRFLATNKQPYVGAIFSAWGYSMRMTEELVVLCAVYMENLSLPSVTAYEEITGRPIQMGDCVPGRAGEAIDGDDVLRRLATVVLGGNVRRDEKAGIKIDRRRGLQVVWPYGE